MPTASPAPLRKESADGNLGVSPPRGRQVPFAPTSRTKFFRKFQQATTNMAIFQQLGRKTLPIQPFQQKRDTDADEKD
jgi:hypothetical protein